MRHTTPSMRSIVPIDARQVEMSGPLYRVNFCQNTKQGLFDMTLIRGLLAILKIPKSVKTAYSGRLVVDLVITIQMHSIDYFVFLYVEFSQTSRST